MRICLLSMEIFAWGKHGGYGRATRVIGRELARRGVPVTAVVPRRGSQGPVERLDGIEVLSFEPGMPWRAARLLRECNADVYHSQEPSFTTYLAQKIMPSRAHLVTLRDTHDLSDWIAELRFPSLNRLQVLSNKLYEDNLLVQRAVRRASRVCAAAEFLRAKGARKYRLASLPELLPTPVAVPHVVEKAATPTVCYLARWDRRKRPEIFLDLAGKFPRVRFVAFGTSRDRAYERQLRSRYASVPNLELAGYVDQFGSGLVAETLSASWILVNTSVREGLPNAFLEAAAHGCAILSSADPDGFASRFGARVVGDDFAAGLSQLLANNRWRECGALGREYVRTTYELELAMDRHLRHYRELTGAQPV
ncbi:MAG TPA: glycosyltransferase family 4 protein [Gemmatimonadales bacterium]